LSNSFARHGTSTVAARVQLEEADAAIHELPRSYLINRNKVEQNAPADAENDVFWGLLGRSVFLGKQAVDSRTGIFEMSSRRGLLGNSKGQGRKDKKS
jgi:hypothetical protein